MLRTNMRHSEVVRDRRLVALKNLPKTVQVLEKDERVKQNKRSQTDLDHERTVLLERTTSHYVKPRKGPKRLRAEDFN